MCDLLENLAEKRFLFLLVFEDLESLLVKQEVSPFLLKTDCVNFFQFFFFFFLLEGCFVSLYETSEVTFFFFRL